MKIIEISDFSPGRNTWDHQLMIASGACASGSVNVWHQQGALTKMPGVTELVTVTSTCGAVGWLYAESAITTAYSLYALLATSTGAANITTGVYYPWGGVGTMTPLGYVTGSVSISGASLVSATGNGTSWSTHVSAGDAFRVNSSAANWFRVSSVEDNTHLTLAQAVPVAVATGSAYTVMPGVITTGDSQTFGFSTLNGIITYGNTTFTVIQFDTTGTTRNTAAPKAAFWQVYKDYLFALRTTTAESRLYWSTIRDPVSWPASNFIDIDKGKGRGSGLYAFGNELIVFKTNGMYKVVGEIFDASNPTYAVYPIKTPEGFQFNSNYTCALYKGRLLFYTRGHIWAYSPGANSISSISQRMTQDLQLAFNATELIAGADITRSAVSFNDFYILNQMDGPSSRHQFGILDEKGAWWIARNTSSGESSLRFPYAGNLVVIGPSTSSKPRLVMPGHEPTIANPILPRICVLDLIGPTYTTNHINDSDATNVAIEATWLSKELNINFGTFKWITVYLEKQTAGNLSLAWSIDQGSFTSYNIDMTVGRGNMIRAVVQVNQRGSTIQLRLQNTTAGQTFRVFGLQILYEPGDESRLL